MRPQIVLLGDSITERGFVFSMNGWALQLASWYGVKADIVNRGHSGYNTRIAMELLEERREGWYHSMDSERPADLVVIFWGANDAALNGKQGIPVTEYKQRLRTQIHNVRCAGKAFSKSQTGSPKDYTQVIIITPPPVDDNSWLSAMKEKYAATNTNATPEDLASITLDRNNDTTKLYAEAAKEVGVLDQCPVIDLYNDMQNASKNYCSFLSDGLHLSSEGNDFLYKSLRSTIKKSFPELQPKNITKDFLEWRDALEASDAKRKELASQ
uniref:SGNH hydrolase-type esterase domain-containing protein n=1 Tax=Vannella robusta TaxID=1487602 RepID=A0A7S4IHU9_9EUKA|mmetsp:Transcript_2663/g.3263  ORF Transcript_2663/g.3263 Transcript_2663/m.3263 type:complete len:269 (+) Transcript_2663:3-809(+)